MFRLTAKIEGIGEFNVNVNKSGTDVTIDPKGEPTRGYSEMMFKTRADAACYSLNVVEQLEAAFSKRPQISIC